MTIPGIILLHVYGNSEPFQNQEKTQSLKVKHMAFVCGVEVAFLSKMTY